MKKNMESNKKYSCNLCNYSNNSVTNFQKHLSTQKHLRNSKKEQLEIPTETTETVNEPATEPTTESTTESVTENLENDIINDFFILTQDDCLTNEYCNYIIDKFVKDDRKYEGKTMNGIQKNMKNTTDLFISALDDWRDIDSYLYTRVTLFLKKYIDYTRDSDEDYKGLSLAIFGNTVDFGYQLQEYIKNEGEYRWHTDDIYTPEKCRLLTFIVYLNDVNIGGETEFGNGQRIIPKAGKILFFPATWTYKHRGKMPISNNKYILTGWIGYKL
jgi:hypothetical protein